MEEYDLDYPRLYAVLDRHVLHSKWRARFFRILELFLGSTHLPLTLLASFLKRLARLSLHAPPAAIVIVIPFDYNILKRNTGLMVIHRAEGTYITVLLPSSIFSYSTPAPSERYRRSRHLPSTLQLVPG